MSAIFWDTNLFVYLIEQTPNLHDRVISLWREMKENQDLLVTSTLTLGELLVKPFEENRQDLIDIYRSMLKSSEVILIQFDELVAENFAKIRAQYPKKVKPPDAIQLACASSYGVAQFITNDDRLNGIKVDRIGRISPLQQAR